MNIEFAITLDGDRLNGLVDVEGVMVEFHSAMRDSFTPFLPEDMPGMDVNLVLALYRDYARYAFTLPPTVSLDDGGCYTTRHDYAYQGVRSITRYEHHRLIDALMVLSIPISADTLQQRLADGRWTSAEVRATLVEMPYPHQKALMSAIAPDEWPDIDWTVWQEQEIVDLVNAWLDKNPAVMHIRLHNDNALYDRCLGCIDIIKHPHFPSSNVYYNEIPIYHIKS